MRFWRCKKHIPRIGNNQWAVGVGEIRMLPNDQEPPAEFWEEFVLEVADTDSEVVPVFYREKE